MLIPDGMPNRKMPAFVKVTRRMAQELRMAYRELGVEVSEARVAEKLMNPLEHAFAHYFAKEVGEAMGVVVSVESPDSDDCEDDA